MPDFQLEPLAAPEDGRPGLTFVVSKAGNVVYTQELTTHKMLTIRSGRVPEDIAWGGVLDPAGNWVRPSVDYGDAPQIETRDTVVNLLRSALG